MGTLYTVGYEGADIDRFVRTLLLAGVSVVADVRAVPISRKKGFSKLKLAAHLAEAGIEYIHFVSLGDPKPGRDAARAGQFSLFRSIYSRHLNTEAALTQLSHLKVVVRERATALLCFEKNPQECHRAMVANSISSDLGYRVINLFADKPERYVCHLEALPRRHLSESLAAAE